MLKPVRVALVFGTRPEAIKLVPVIQKIAGDDRFVARCLVTGQHRELVDEVLAPFGVVPDTRLEIMREGQSINDIVSAAVPLLDSLYSTEQPDLVVVQGDTTSAFCAALAAFHRRIPVAHVEAGLRSFDRRHPYPEEANRRMLTALTDLHFTPTRQAASQLIREGVPAPSVIVSGNTVVDALLMALAAPVAAGSGPDRSPDGSPDGSVDGQLVLITLHRRESWDAPNGEASPLEGILEAIRASSIEHPDVTYLFPVHPNPRVRRPVERLLGDRPNVRLVAPMAHVPFIRWMARASAIVTDSGGVQEEAPSLGVPALVVRRTTERCEGLGRGGNKLVGMSPDRIRVELGRLLERPRNDGPIPRPSPFGDGRAAERIRDGVLHFAGRGPRPDEFLAASPREDLDAPVERGEPEPVATAGGA